MADRGIHATTKCGGLNMAPRNFSAVPGWQNRAADMMAAG